MPIDGFGISQLSTVHLSNSFVFFKKLWVHSGRQYTPQSRFPFTITMSILNHCRHQSLDFIREWGQCNARFTADSRRKLLVIGGNFRYLLEHRVPQTMNARSTMSEALEALNFLHILCLAYLHFTEQSITTTIQRRLISCIFSIKALEIFIACLVSYTALFCLFYLMSM